MSTTTEDVLLSDDRIDDMADAKYTVRPEYSEKEIGEAIALSTAYSLGGSKVRDLYEADRTKLLDLIRQGVEAVSEIHRINKDLARRGPDTAAKLCEKLSATYLSAVKEELPNL